MPTYGSSVYGMAMEREVADRDPTQMPLDALLSWVGDSVDRHRRRLAVEHGLTATALRVLEVLGHRDGFSHRELAGRVGITPATLTPVVDTLEATGELRRERDPADRRIVRLVITKAGRDRAHDAGRQVEAGMADRLPRLHATQERAVRAYAVAVLAALADDS